MESAKVQKNQKVYFSKKRKIQKKYKVKKVGRYGVSSCGKQGDSASFAAQTRGMGRVCGVNKEIPLRLLRKLAEWGEFVG